MPDVTLIDIHEIETTVPAWVKDNATFIQWAEANAGAQRGKIGYFAGTVWIDTTGEAVAHNQIKLAIAVGIMNCAEETDQGTFYASGMMFSVPDVELSSEPDGFFVSNESLENRKVWLEDGNDSMVVYGIPDIVIEVADAKTEEKDLKILRKLYHQAGISEYWVVKELFDSPSLIIYRHTSTGYVPVRAQNGWVRSQVLGAQFQLSVSEAGEDACLHRK